MNLRIENETTLKDVQMEFNALYPFLQLHFFRTTASEGKYFKKMEKLPAELSIKQLRLLQSPVSVSVEQKKTVAELLKNFMDLGMLAQVFRKSGNHWVETSLTSDWTLERQNTEAMLISIPDHQLLSSRHHTS